MTHQKFDWTFATEMTLSVNDSELCRTEQSLYGYIY